MSTEAIAANTTTPFYYWNTDAAPPAGVPCFKLSPGNVSPALAIWLLMTTNPQWTQIMAVGGIDAALTDIDTVAASAGLTPGSAQWIINRMLASEETKNAFYLVALAFQDFKLKTSDAVTYHPPYCPHTLEEIMRFDPAALVQHNPGTEVNP